MLDGLYNDETYQDVRNRWIGLVILVAITMLCTYKCTSDGISNCDLAIIEESNYGS